MFSVVSICVCVSFLFVSSITLKPIETPLWNFSGNELWSEVGMSSLQCTATSWRWFNISDVLVYQLYLCSLQVTTSSLHIYYYIVLCCTVGKLSCQLSDRVIVWHLFAEDGLLRPKRERRSRERSHGSRSRDHKRSRRSRSREHRGSKSRDRRRGDRESAAATNGQVFVKQEVEDAAGEYGTATGENNYYNEHAAIDPANY